MRSGNQIRITRSAWTRIVEVGFRHDRVSSTHFTAAITVVATLMILYQFARTFRMLKPCDSASSMNRMISRRSGGSDLERWPTIVSTAAIRSCSCCRIPRGFTWCINGSSGCEYTWMKSNGGAVRTNLTAISSSPIFLEPAAERSKRG